MIISSNIYEYIYIYIYTHVTRGSTNLSQICKLISISRSMGTGKVMSMTKSEHIWLDWIWIVTWSLCYLTSGHMTLFLNTIQSGSQGRYNDYALEISINFSYLWYQVELVNIIGRFFHGELFLYTIFIECWGKCFNCITTER